MNVWNKMGIYEILCKGDNKRYIGSSVDLGDRWSLHLNQLLKKKHHSILLQRAWDKYGANLFEWKVLEFIKDKNILINREQYWMDKYKSYDSRYGFNICVTAGRAGRTGPLPLEERRRRQEIRLASGHRKLNEKQVSKIKQKILKGEKLRHIARYYGVDASTISDIKRGKVWEFVLPDISHLDLTLIGSKNPSAKVTEEEVVKIKNQLLQGKRQTDLALKYKVPLSLIVGIRLGKTWTHLGPSLQNIPLYQKKLGSSRPRITKKIVLKIRKLLLKGLSSTDISTQLGIGYSAVYSIKIGKTWKHLTN